MHIMGTPVPRRNIEIESKDSRPGPVKSYFLSPEEIALLEIAKPIPASHTMPIIFRPKRSKDQS